MSASHQHTPARPYGTVVFGVGLVAAGVLLLLDQLDVVEAGPVIADWWPVVVVAIGISQLLNRQRALGGIVIGVGLLLLLSTTDLLDVNVGALIGPLVLVVLGGAILLAARQTAGGRGGRVTVFGEAEMRGSAAELDATTSYCVFGDLDIVVEGEGSPGQRITIGAYTVFGDTDVRIPTGWGAVDRSVTLLGDSAVKVDEAPEGAPVVEVTGLVLFGDLKIHRT